MKNKLLTAFIILFISSVISTSIIAFRLLNYRVVELEQRVAWIYMMIVPE